MHTYIHTYVHKYNKHVYICKYTINITQIHVHMLYLAATDLLTIVAVVLIAPISENMKYYEQHQ